MAFRIVWTKRASKGFQEIIAYLEEHWTEKAIAQFMIQCYSFFELLKKHPKMLQKTGKRKYVHRGPIKKHTVLTYRIRSRK